MSESPDIDSLVSQLQGISKAVNNIDQIAEQTSVTKENLEQFIIDKASKLVDNTNETISYLTRLVQAAPDAKEVAALAELIKASSSTLDTLSKMVVSEKKNNTTKEIKQLEIAMKQKPDDVTKLKYTRDEIFKQLFTEEPIDTNLQPVQSTENTN